MNITVNRAVIEQALESLNYVMRHGPAVQKAKDLLRTALGHQYMTNAAPLYTSPPQHKPLSDDEIQALWEKAFDSGSSPRDFARAIEAAHNIKD